MVRKRPAKRRRARRRRTRRLGRWLPSRQRRRRWLRALRRAPAWVRLGAAAGVLAATALATNAVYQVARKPTELFFPVSGTLAKTPAGTWATYGRSFRRHATDVIRADLLAALAQVEGSGDPVARPPWRWAWRVDPREIYRPASSAVGMYQITDGTFEQARRLCIHDHRVVEEGPWHAWKSCWFVWSYFRVVPSHAIELTSAFLDRSVSRALARAGLRGVSLEQKQRLAALIHLCGAGAGSRQVKRGLGSTAGMRCGTHDASAYLAKVARMQRVFRELAARDDA